MYVDLIFINIV